MLNLNQEFRTKSEIRQLASSIFTEQAIQQHGIINV
jgi:hypothetical protein